MFIEFGHVITQVNNVSKYMQQTTSVDNIFRMYVKLAVQQYTAEVSITAIAICNVGSRNGERF